MNLWLVLICVGVFTFLFFEYKSIRRGALRKRVRSALPGFVELYSSAIQSGINPADAFSYLVEFNIEGLQVELRELESNLHRGISFEQCLNDFRGRISVPEVDRFVAILKLSHAAGGQNLVANLKTLSEELRSVVSSEGAIESRLGAVLIVAKLGLLAPWVLVAVLSVNEQSRAAYLSDSGGLLLLIGFLFSVLAYRLVMFAGRPFTTPRILAGLNV